jgi:hypothetical protein
MVSLTVARRLAELIFGILGSYTLWFGIDCTIWKKHVFVVVARRRLYNVLPAGTYSMIIIRRLLSIIVWLPHLGFTFIKAYRRNEQTCCRVVGNHMSIIYVGVFWFTIRTYWIIIRKLCCWGCC